MDSDLAYFRDTVMEPGPFISHSTADERILDST